MAINCSFNVQLLKLVPMVEPLQSNQECLDHLIQRFPWFGGAIKVQEVHVLNREVFFIWRTQEFSL